MLKFLSFTFLCLFANTVLGQTGKITGKVIDEQSGQAISNATVELERPKKTVITDLNGNFTIAGLAAGSYNIKCSYVSYDSKIVEGLVVTNNDVTNINVSLVASKNSKLDDVVITTTRVKAVGENNASLLAVQKMSASVMDGVTTEVLKRTPARTASDAIKLVSGASIQDDKFAIIRGLNDRYNASFINGTPLPSTESDRKAFSFDIFPSAILDNLVIFKTATPDKTGDFAGGIIDITTKATTPKNFNSISFSTSYNSLATGNTRFFSENKSSTDFIGLDDGLRGIPAGFPVNINDPSLSIQKVAAAAKLFRNFKWGVRHENTKPNVNFQFTKGLNIQRKEKEFFGALVSVNYSKNYGFNPGNRDQFSQDGAIQFVQLNDSLYNDETIFSALANFSLKINSKNSISFKNNLSVNTDNRLFKRRSTPDLQGDPNVALREVVRAFTSNLIQSSQILGEHLVGNKKTKINWLAAATQVKRDLPNLARSSYSYNPNDPNSGLGSAFQLGTLTQITGNGTMFFVKSNESIKSIQADISQPYELFKNPQMLKIGGGFLSRNRSFTSRLLGFTPYTTGSVQQDFSLNELPEDQIFLIQHMGLKTSGKGGWTIDENNPAYNNYDASSKVTHAYIMSDQRFFKNLRIIYGVRMEKFNQQLYSDQSLGSTLQPLTINTTVTDFLPSVNAVYALTKKMNVRLSFAETVNRPEYRELAEVVFYDYLQQYSLNGNSKLQRAKIKNYDFRYEFFPGKAQLFSASVFYKEFKNPIEFLFIPALLGTQGFYGNTTSATLKGVEFEFRSLVSTLFGVTREKSILNKFTLSANASFTESRVQILDTIALAPPNEFRNNDPLQGQSPFIVNGSLNFTDNKLGISTTISANKFGDRILVKGFALPQPLPNLLEKGRTVIDFQFAKLFLNNQLEVKMNIRDLLAQDIVQYRDFNEKSSTLTNTDQLFSVYKAPITVSIGVSYKF
jgi:hypothetical protein